MVKIQPKKKVGRPKKRVGQPKPDNGLPKSTVFYREPVPPEVRKEKVWELYVAGWSMARIGEQFGVSAQAIGNDLKLRRDEIATIQEESALNSNVVREVANERYALTIKEALSEWYRSKEDSTGFSEEECALRERLGDPRYLAIIIKAQQRLDAINGLDAAQKMDMNLNQQVTFDWSALFQDPRQLGIILDPVEEQLQKEAKALQDRLTLPTSNKEEENGDE